MTREEAYNMAYEDLDSMYHSTWIRTVIDEIYNDFEHITCDGCKYKDTKDSIHPLEPCSSCSRFYGDYWESKDE